MIDLKKYSPIYAKSYMDVKGKVTKLVGLTVESIGPDASLNDVCLIVSRDRSKKVRAEVIGFKEEHLLLMPYEDINGIGVGSTVINMHEPLRVPVGMGLLGQNLDGLGYPLGGGELALEDTYPVEAPAPDPMSRVLISEVLTLGVRAVDGLLTIGKGQRIGIFAGSGVGKSTLLGMFARNTKADVNVIALIDRKSVV